MKFYTFTGPASGATADHTTTVKAECEKDARYNAMVARHGPPSGMYLTYYGQGLNLINVTPAS